jgi:hypothetical protein
MIHAQPWPKERREDSLVKLFVETSTFPELSQLVERRRMGHQNLVSTIRYWLEKNSSRISDVRSEFVAAAATRRDPLDHLNSVLQQAAAQAPRSHLVLNSSSRDIPPTSLEQPR